MIGRDVLTLVLLGAFGLAGLSAFPRQDFEARVRLLLEFNSGRAALAPFWFDPPYASFLDGVRRATPKDATVAVVVPAGELYVLQAAYALAPRRVLPASLEAEASYVAFYEPGRAGEAGLASAIANGRLLRR